MGTNVRDEQAIRVEIMRLYREAEAQRLQARAVPHPDRDFLGLSSDDELERDRQRYESEVSKHQDLEKAAEGAAYALCWVIELTTDQHAMARLKKRALETA